jgi:hypothetical protein
MKKVVLGCLGALVLFAVVGGGAMYWFVYRPAKEYIASFSQLQEIPKLEQQVRNRAAFTPPGTGELTADQLTRFVSAQRMVHDRLGARVKELDAKHKALNKPNGEQPSVIEVLSGLKDLTGLIIDAKRVQIEALNQQRFSLEEYAWTRKTVYAAMGIALGDFQQAIDKASRGERVTADAMTGGPALGEVPDKNKGLVAPFAKQLEEYAGLAFFGL